LSVAGSTFGTLCLRVSFHSRCPLFYLDLLSADQEETNMHCGYLLARGLQHKLNAMQTC
jgi:hypothetical protein